MDDKFQDGSIELDELYQNITAYDPITGNFFFVPLTEKKDKSQITLQLSPGQSIILFADCGKKSKVPYESFKGSVIPLRTEWTIDFGKGEAVPSPVLTVNLASWTELGDSLHCYYSGTGTYRTTFDLPVGLEKLLVYV